jgi:hypothetical protein
MTLGVCDKAIITLYDISRFKTTPSVEESDQEEEGEFEIEEGEEEEIEEIVGIAEDLPEFENSPDKVEVNQLSQPSPIE